MDIFIGQLVGFAVIVLLFWKYVLPPLRKAVVTQQEAIGTQLVESEAAKNRVVDAQAAHDRAIENAKTEAEELHRGALADAEAITSDIKAQADSEVRRITEHGKSQTDLVRSNLVRTLRGDLGLAAVDGAGKIVRDHLADPANQSASVDQVIDDLESMVAGGSDVVAHSSDLVGLHSMRAASRDAARKVSAEFDSASKDLDAAHCDEAADELVQVIEFLHENPVLRKKLSEVADDTTPKETLVRRLFEGKVSPVVLTVLLTAAKGRWSSTPDFVAGLRRQAALIVLTAAEREGTIEQVEDDLFRVSRLLEANPYLSSLLGDHTAPAENRIGLLKKVAGDGLSAHSWYLVTHLIRIYRGHSLDVAADQLAELAAARRGESVAHVVSATTITDAQRTRLAGVLGKIYGRRISVQTEVDESLLGGLRIGVGDEVIDADIATRLAKATQTLPN